MGGQNDIVGSITAIIGIVFTLVICGLIINTLYTASVNATGPNSTATKAIGAEANSFNALANLITFFLEPIHDLELLAAICGGILSAWYLFFRNNNQGGRL